MKIADIEKNMKAAGAAAIVAAFVDEEFEFHGDRFLEELALMLPKKLCKPKEKKAPLLRPMTQQEARNFGSVTVPFGKYNNVAVDNVPMDWLQWLADQTFVDNLRRYLESERVKSE